MKDKISVIIPCYNVQKYVIRCFNSIQNQTYGFENLEVIFIDDLSTDNTWSILESLQVRYPANVIAIKAKNKGMCGGARNIGLDICSGKYITFVDADDYIHPQMVELLYKRMAEDNFDIVRCEIEQFDSVYPEINQVQEDIRYENIDLSNINNRKNMIIRLPGLDNIVVYGKLYSSDFIMNNRLRFLENVYFEDNHFSFMCIMLAEKYCVIKHRMYFYYNNIEGITGSRMSFSKILDLNKNIDGIREELKTRDMDKSLGRLCRSEIQIFFLWKEYFETWDKLQSAWQDEQKIYAKEVLLKLPDILENAYVQNFSDDRVLKKMDYLRTMKGGNSYKYKYGKEAVHIGFGLHDKNGDYSVWVGTTIQSIIEHSHAKIVFHILHDDTLNDDNCAKLKTLVENSGNILVFHYCEANMFESVEESMGRFTIGSLFRIVLPEVLSDLNKIVYLDADLFVNRDIKELWDVDIENYFLAAVPDNTTIKGNGTPYAVAMGQTTRNKYFNSGVLVMNLDKMRKNGNTFQLVMKYLKENEQTFLPDQDALNAIYANGCFLLDASWNYFIDEVRRVKNTKLEKKIYHYAATKLVLYFKNEVDIAYYQTILRTPWGQIEGERQLSRSLIKMNDRIEQLELLIENMTNKNKKVIFYGNSVSMSNVMKMLHVDKKTCVYVDVMDEDELSKYKDAFFIVSAEADNGKGIEKLEKNGFTNGKNFVVTQRLVGPYEGGFLF